MFSLRPDPTETAVTVLEINDRQIQILALEVRPQGIAEIKLAVGALPQQEIAQPQLAAGADDQLRVGDARRPQVLAEILLRPFLAALGAQAGGPQDLGPAAVVQADVGLKALALVSAIICCSLGESAVVSPRIFSRM